MPAENESPAREPATRGRGRGWRGGRGGRGRGGSKLAASAVSSAAKLSASKPGRGGTRRGRAKSFTDSRVQAAYERQRHLKATYQAVAHAIKPALQELAERSIEELLQKPQLFKTVAEHQPVARQLQRNLQDSIAQHERRMQRDLKLAKDTYEAEIYVAEREFQNAVDDMEEQFYQGQENRVRILHALSAKGLPVDVRDDQYEYKTISDAHLDRDFGIYECYKSGHLVPYPSRVKGTEMWRRGRDADAAVAAASLNAPTKGRGRGRGVNKRRAQDQPDGQPTPKKSTRGSDDAALEEQEHMAPAPAKGLLASAAEAEAHPNGVAEEESVPASPEPINLTNGVSAAAKDPAKLHAREKSPPLPKNVGEPDEYGIRVYNQRGPREKALTSRFMAPPVFNFNDWEIGFRDTSNDSSKGHTRAKRGKYLDTPNNTAWHFDHWCNGYDYSIMDPEELDQDLVEAHGLHPKYGIFLPTSTNDLIENRPYEMPGKPVVFIATPSGRVSFASRSLIPTLNHRRSQEAPFRLKFGASLRRFCKMADLDLVSVAEYLPSFNEWKKKSLGTASKEMKKRPIKEIGPETDEEVVPEEPNTKEPPAADTGLSAMSVLTYASAYVNAQDAVKSAPPPPKPARYDAIRDVFTDSKPADAPAPEPISLSLSTLAELCNMEARLPGGTGIVLQSDYKSPAKKVETPRAPVFEQLPPSQRLDHHSPYNYPARDRAFPQPPSSGTLPESSAYPPIERSLPPPATMDYKPHYPPPPPPPGPISQDHGYYYPPPDPRDPGRPLDHGYGHRRLSGFGSEAPPPPQSYSRGPYWSQQSSSAPPPAVPQPQSFGAPPPPPSRLSFAQAAGNEPLPPLRPPRRNQSLPEESMHDSQRSNIHSSIYYPPGPSRSYHRTGLPTEPLAPLHSIASERLLPNPSHSQSYMGSPPPGYTHQALSPTFGNPGLPGSMGQSPPGTPQGLHGGIHRHRSTPSGSSDAGSNKYRKLQPAPVPAHRSWASKPELKTIPYDHKETGALAALPSSGPTQIRGWNVNQPRKRSKAEKQERAESTNERDDSR